MQKINVSMDLICEAIKFSLDNKNYSLAEMLLKAIKLSPEEVKPLVPQYKKKKRGPKKKISVPQVTTTPGVVPVTQHYKEEDSEEALRIKKRDYMRARRAKEKESNDWKKEEKTV